MIQNKYISYAGIGVMLLMASMLKKYLI